VQRLSSFRERATFISNQRSKQDGYQKTIQTTGKHAAMWQHQSDDLQNVSEKGFFATTFSLPFKDQSGAWRISTSFGLNDLEALATVVHQAKEWIATHALKPEPPQQEAFVVRVVSQK
jgi:hypothetical protein